MRRPILFLTCLLAIAPISAEDWPQILGPNRDGVYAGVPLADTWPAAGPPVLWKHPVGQGLAGVAVVSGRVILFHRVKNEEVVESLNAVTGKTQWRFAYPTTYRDDFGFDEGPRAVPVVADGRVYTFGAEGELTALELSTGKHLWNVNVMKRFGVRKGYFGAAGSPLVEGRRVLLNAGGRDQNAGIVAFSANAGAVLWTATDHEPGYSSPTVATLGGTRYAIFLTREGLVGLDPASGAVRFEQRWRARSAASVNAATPLVVGDVIFISASYDTGATAVRVAKDTLTSLWESKDVLSNHYATSVHADGVLYGFHGRQEFGQSFRAVDLATGRVRWSTDRFGAGSVMLADGRLLIAHERGDLILAAATPKAFHQLARASVLSGTVRAFPALADGVLYLRNDDTLVALDLK
jgi:outer membrane protein assembly factor BamB